MISYIYMSHAHSVYTVLTSLVFVTRSLVVSLQNCLTKAHSHLGLLWHCGCLIDKHSFSWTQGCYGWMNWIVLPNNDCKNCYLLQTVKSSLKWLYHWKRCWNTSGRYCEYFIIMKFSKPAHGTLPNYSDLTCRHFLATADFVPPSHLQKLAAMW
jgi:hypothetical protein